MSNDIKGALRPAIGIFVLLALITGLIYPLAITAIAQAVFPHQANGSLVREGDIIVGSELVGQGFVSPRYFHPRPSAAGDGYDASASSGSNLGPTSADLEAAVVERVAAARADGVTGPVPAHMATASGSGLDPDISPAMAMAQVDRIASARGMPPQALRQLVERSIDHPTLGVLGESHVNVLRLNRQLDRMAPQSRP
ncbi:potassium-transporting ATPase subunit KdpC [Sphingosinicella terrae]|uniref:potassium-transporting ATPase subunit KdpC n=1 Tax=Sphingosinicella terrae TaxID=2172047 RepID=UPI000E0CF889|nr:potassium-transporting ATPase subunit KdpC [Sphingosinicella terrae]